MKTLPRYKLIGMLTLFTVALAACSDPGPAETAGKKLDQTANAATRKINDVVDKADKKLDEQSAKTGMAMDDAAITAKIKAAIFAEPGLKTLQISVNTVAGIVTLSGSVNSQSNSNMAQGLASAVAGVKSVDNHLILTPIS